ncbi:monomethylamine:corrinoid methyltransferase [Parasporobacterium paucivorans DSM 15970]|uniref:Monomethylamine:corrinoid methyltransferase n=1 Tax=Parasporobacterium paucivorans DSM 15970 TaxID=1122934 RepID=A0A1M6IHB1_9FIRM|nr:monomethylamine:corrinoid methyltransferase [Parasporobacterium paucivorans DSM 15970]
MEAIAKGVTVFDVYDRAKTGPKMEEKDWDFKLIPQTAKALKKKYGIKMDKNTIIPEDKELIDNLFNAGVDMLVDCGVYCIDTGRVIKYSRDEVLHAIKSAPDHFRYGEDKEAINVVPRPFNSTKAPVIQGGPTGSPCSEEMFMTIHQSYAQEPIIDTIVDGVLQTIMGKDPVPGSPWEIMAVRSEALQVREAQMRAGRKGMGL